MLITARVIVRIRPETTTNLPACDEAVETLRHYFFEFRRVHEFWRLVRSFFESYLDTASHNATPVMLKNILSGLPARKDKVSNLIICHAQIVWQIYQLHAESALENVHNTDTGMFAQWQHEMM
jgi:hypothetical protein